MTQIIGIDLGSTYSVAAIIDEIGTPTIVEDKNKQRNDNLIPSVISFTSNGSVKIGEGPRRSLELDKNTVSRWKRHMGSQKKYKIHDQTLKPEDLSALLLKEIKMIIEQTTGDIAHAVVTIPANFSSNAREATLKAANKAGLNVEDIINEPTAAALYFAYKEGFDLNGKYAVFDLGGGTFDITILKTKGKKLEVLGSDGVHELGGQDFDHALQNIVGNKYKEKTGEELEKEDYTIFNAEEDKKLLSTNNSVMIRVNRKTLKITRDEFEEAISTKIDQTSMKCNLLLEELKLKAGDIDGVILAGGSTRMPCVQKVAQDIFSQETMPVGNPDEMIALGAAIYAATTSDDSLLNKAQKESIENVNLNNSTAEYYGITFLETTNDGSYILKVRNLIKRGEILPAKHTESFSATNPDQSLFRVTESRTLEDDPEWVHVKHEGYLDHPGQKVGDEITVTFAYDINQIMECSFLHVPSGIKKEVSISFDSDIDQTDDDINKFLID